ncbi:MAG: S8 family serine peptidase [Caldilineaceae bacterium]|nr:S8 family serine peptidase [Caldilineaceae bacterium]
MNRPFLSLLIAVLLLGLSFGIAGADAPTPGDLPPMDAFHLGALTGAESELVTILIELEDEPTTRVFAESQARTSTADATARAVDQLQRVDAAQAALLATASLAEATVIYRTQRVFNGVAVQVSAEQIRAIAALPGVATLHPLPVYTVDRSRTVPFIGAPALWDQLRVNGLDGERVSIGIIDTGIDYLHTDFGGPGTGYDLNDPASMADGVSFPTAKVVGGYDFAGNDYNAGSSEKAIPQPDPDPMDCWGHGTHVAGIAAGYGALKDGSTYTGPYHGDLDWGQFAIAPGVAPRADLYALKIFGCSGSSQLVNLAIEWAVDPNGDGDFSDRLDVLNLSLGSSFGGAEDASVVALNNAALVGIVVVAAAGNNGDTYFVAAAPGAADRAISVAASSTVALPLPRGWAVLVDPIANFSSRGPRRGDAALKPDLTAPGSSIVSASAFTGNRSMTSSGTSMATPHVAGAAALLRQLHPGWSVEEIKALLLNTARYDLLTGEGYPPTRYGAGRAGAGRIDLREASRAELLIYNADNPGQVNLSFGAPTVLDQTTIVKTARVVNKSPLTRTLFLTYTSVMDLPGATFDLLGAALRQIPAQGTLNVPVIFSADANTLHHQPDPTVAPGNYFPRHRLAEETGHLYVWPQPLPLQTSLSPTQSGVVSGEDVSAHFVLDPQAGKLSYTLAFTASTPLTLTSVDLRYGSAYSVGPVLHNLVTGTIAISGTVSTLGELEIAADEMRLLAADQLYLSVVLGSAGELRGQLYPQETVLRLPVYVAPRPVAAMRADPPLLDFGFEAAGDRLLTLFGQGLPARGALEATRFPTHTLSLVTALELQFSSPKGTYPKQILDHADLRYIGISSQPLAMPTPVDASAIVASSRLLFGIATYGEWSTPNEVSFRIHFDIDEDGVVDYILRTTNVGSFLGIGASDEFVTVLEDRTRNEQKITYFVNLISAAELNSALFNNNVLLMAVDAADLGLTEANSRFNYLISAHSRDATASDQLVDFSRLLTYDVLRPGISTSGESLGEFPIYSALPGAEIGITFDRNALAANSSEGILLLHHHNERGARAEVVRIRYAWPLYLPRIFNNP